jgi:hypothetical protein
MIAASSTFSLQEDVARKGRDFEPLKITIPLQHIEFAKDNLLRCFAQEHGYKAVEEDIGGPSA